MEVIEALRTSILEPRAHLRINHERAGIWTGVPGFSLV
jgi:hypothetical protein